MQCPLYTLEPQLSAPELRERARRTLATPLTTIARNRLLRLAEHPNAEPGLRLVIRGRLASFRNL